ncbi:hypothetical protein AAMO2058_001004600 [Amorphochlora amoebiformis]
MIDRLPRMKLMTISIAGDNIFVCLAAMLTFATSLVIHDSNALWGLLGGMLACSVIGQFFANTGCMALEKDWVPVIAGEKGSGDIRPMGEGVGEDDVEVKKSLAILNSSLRRIDLTCKFLAPMAFGVMLQFLPYKTDRKIQIGSSVILVWNLATLVPELLLARSIYNDVPELANRPGNQVQRSSQISSKQAHGCTSIPLLGGLIEGWDTWLSSSVMGLSLGYTMLYATVLSPGPLLTAYLKTVGIPEGLVGASMGLGAVFGLVGTVIFRPLASCMPLAGVGFVTIWLWCAFLAPCALVALISDGLGASMDTQQRGYVILICVTVGRMWLWAFDLAETQLLQQMLPESQRGRVSAAQSSLGTLFTLCVYGLSVAFHNPSQFWILVCVSFGFVLLGSVVTSIWTCCCALPSNKDTFEVQFLELHDNDGDYICDYDPNIEEDFENEIFEEVKRNRFTDPDMDDEVESI